MLVFAWSTSLRWKLEMHSIPAAQRNSEGTNVKARITLTATNHPEVNIDSAVRKNFARITLHVDNSRREIHEQSA
jgi:hypothetical protein